MPKTIAKLIKNTIIFIIIVLLFIFIFIFAWIRLEIMKQCRLAQQAYSGDCVSALIQVLEDEDNELEQRNYAIWSLGQLKDERAIPILEKYYTGIIPDREPYDETLSQYELKKALSYFKVDYN